MLPIQSRSCPVCLDLSLGQSGQTPVALHWGLLQVTVPEHCPSCPERPAQNLWRLASCHVLALTHPWKSESYTTNHNNDTILTLSSQTDRCEQTVQTQIGFRHTNRQRNELVNSMTSKISYYVQICSVNPCQAEPRYALPLQIVMIQISWLLMKPIDLDLHCLALSMWTCINNLDQVIGLAEN